MCGRAASSRMHHIAQCSAALGEITRATGLPMPGMLLQAPCLQPSAPSLARGRPNKGRPLDDVMRASLLHDVFHKIAAQQTAGAGRHSRRSRLIAASRHAVRRLRRL